MTNPEQIHAEFAARFGRPCAVVCRAPGRVNLIGEHTDYNDGYVLPIATQHSTWAALAVADEGGAGGQAVVRAYSANVDDQQEWPLNGWKEQPRPHWTSYVAGVAALLRERGARLGGFDVLIRSEVPIGGGLSSSAALSVSVARALAVLSDVVLPSRDLAAVCRQAEHEFAGVPCGYMDQFASLACRADAALLLDCRSLEYEYVPLKLDGHVVLVVDSGVRHELAATEYARRQEQCAQAVAFFQRLDPAVRALRDVDVATVRAHASQMDPLAAPRALHVTSENQRTLGAADALRCGDLAELGCLMSESHRSLRDAYEVSCPELDLLVRIVGGVRGVLGARMTGGGFGGSIVAIAPQSRLADIEQELGREYDTPKRQARLFEVRPGPGASIAHG